MSQLLTNLILIQPTPNEYRQAKHHVTMYNNTRADQLNRTVEQANNTLDDSHVCDNSCAQRGMICVTCDVTVELTTVEDERWASCAKQVHSDSKIICTTCLFVSCVEPPFSIKTLPVLLLSRQDHPLSAVFYTTSRMLTRPTWLLETTLWPT